MYPNGTTIRTDYADPAPTIEVVKYPHLNNKHREMYDTTLRAKAREAIEAELANGDQTLEGMLNALDEIPVGYFDDEDDEDEEDADATR